MRRRLAAVAALTLLSAGCGDTPTVTDAAESPPWFEDITDDAGLDFVHDAGPTDSYFMPQSVGSGAALFDFDGDDRLDIYLPHNAGPSSGSTNRLYRQTENGTFEDVSDGSGIDFADHCMGTAAGDFDNDGRVDLFVSSYSGARLFRNLGGGKFADVTDTAGLEQRLWGTSAAFIDYDRDGLLDLAVANYVIYDESRPCRDLRGRHEYCAPHSFLGTVTKLYRNLGGGKFEDVTLKAGLGKATGPGLGIVCADFTGDGWLDMFVANDGRPNHLWVNRHDGTFAEEALAAGLAYNAMGESEADMGVAVGDINGDGLFDLFVPHLDTESHTVWLQSSPGSFADRTDATGILQAGRGTGFGAALADLNLDGLLDLAVVNGRIARRKSGDAPAGSDALEPHWRDYSENDQLLRGEPDGRFAEISGSQPAFCSVPAVSRGLACGDIDNDGDIDLLVTAIGSRARLFRNVAPRGHWLTVRTFDPALKRDAHGAVVTVEAGDTSCKRWAHPTYSYLCSNDPRANFGLGDAREYDRIRVAWPDGTEEIFPGGPADRFVEVRKGEGVGAAHAASLRAE